MGLCEKHFTSSLKDSSCELVEQPSETMRIALPLES